MESHQVVVSSLENSSFAVSDLGRNSSSSRWNSGSMSEKNGGHRKETMLGSSDNFGVLEVHIHQARDIHNICIYHKQDVYAKLCLTSDPETTVSTQIINGGGKNPVFNESLQLSVRNTDASLKCEVWMLSRVRNYLEDQLLGVALIPLSEIFMENGSLAREFSLSSTDLFHSPAGFVQLSISYIGDSPEVLEIPTPRASQTSNSTLQNPEIPDTLQSDYDKIEFADPNIVNENNLMVQEYYGMSFSTLDSQSSESFSTVDTDNNISSSVEVHVVQSPSDATSKAIEVTENHSPASSVLTNGSPSSLIPASSKSLPDSTGASRCSNDDVVSPPKDNKADAVKDRSDSSNGNTFAQSFMPVSIVPEQMVVQQDIVDMYMKSMQQFTESLAKMKLPMDIENGTTITGNIDSGADKKLQTSKATGQRVFYGSRAFF